MNKLNTEFVKKKFEEEGYILLDEYTKATTKMRYICPKGHEHSIDWHHFKNGRRCPYCATEKSKVNFNKIKKAFKDRGYTLLEEEYINSQTPMEYICPNGHKHTISWNSFNSGKGCPECWGHTKLSLKYIEEEFKKVGWTLLTTEYVNTKQRLEYICDKGHKYTISWDKFKEGKGCPCCKGNRLTIEMIREKFKKEGYTLLSTHYMNGQKLEYLCDKGHRHFTTWDNFQQGYRCSYCKSSKGETKIKDILDVFGIKYIYNKNIWSDCYLRPDFYLENYNLVIEYDGIQHFEPIEYFGGKEKLKITQQKDAEKNDYCKNNNIDILRIPYWEYENIENILKQKLNLEKPSTTRT